MLSKFFLKQSKPAFSHGHFVFNNLTHARAILPSNLSCATFFTTAMRPRNPRQIVKQMDAARFFSSSSSDIDSGSDAEAEEEATSFRGVDRSSDKDAQTKFIDVRNLVEIIDSGEFDNLSEYQLMV